MRILDTLNNVIENPNFDLGHLIEDRIFVQHHEAVIGRAEEGHYEVIAEYKDHNGDVYGKDVAWIVDVEAIEEKEAWDEYEDILRFIEFTPEELQAREDANKAENAISTQVQELQAKVDELLNIKNENEILKATIASLQEQLALQEECLVEVANIIYA